MILAWLIALNATVTSGIVPEACTKPEAEAAVKVPAKPKIPHGLTIEEHVTVLVEVEVGRSGHAERTVVFKSSGNAVLDKAALVAAQRSTYAPKLFDCTPVEGDVLFRADFGPLVLVANVPVAAASCPNPNIEATVAWPVEPKVPQGVRIKEEVTVPIEVWVTPSGRIQKMAIFKSSGSAAINKAALDAAQRSTYAPKLVDCRPVEGVYLLRTHFSPP